MGPTVVNGLRGLRHAGIVIGSLGIFQVVTSPAQRAKLPQALAESRAYGPLDRVVSTFGSGPGTVLGKQRRHRLPCSVVGDDERRNGVSIDRGACCLQRDDRLLQQTLTVGRVTGEPR
jgi:hypothetical protein